MAYLQLMEVCLLSVEIVVIFIKLGKVGTFMKKRLAKKAIVLTTLFSLALPLYSSSVTFAAEPDPGVSILKIDRDDRYQLPKDFRTSNDAFKRTPKDGKLPSREGMDTLYVSGSSIATQLETAQMLQKLPADRLIIVDLRLESHGYLDGRVVSWYGAYNTSNVGLSQKQVEKREKQLVKDTLNGEAKLARLNGDKSVGTTMEVKVNQALTEEELVTDVFGVKYYRIPCADYVKPSDANVDQFIKWYKTLPKDAWLHFHCHAGEGRTTVFMAMVDMIKNHDKVSYEDIMKRHYLIGGQDIRSATSSDPWKKKIYPERAQFTKNFYDYVKANPEMKMSWADWAKQHNY